MSDESSYTNPQTTWTNDRYYEVGLIAFVLGLGHNMYLFDTIKKVGAEFLGLSSLFAIFIGIPLMILELSLSQYGQKGMIYIWDLCPIFRGLGYLCVLYLFLTVVEDLTMISYLARYLVNAFSTTTGWDSCDNEWNTEFCYTIETNISRRLDCYDLHGKEKCDKTVWESSFSQYWHLVVQNIEIGMFQWRIIGYCLGIVIIAFALTFKGIKMIEKVIYWALIIAAVQFTILTYCSFIQHGSGMGLAYLFSWNWNLYTQKRVWALSFQHFITAYSLGSGGLRTLGSQNKFRGNSYMNAMMLILVNMTVIFLYCVLYHSLCGNLAYHSNHHVKDITEQYEPEFFSKVPRMINRLNGPKRLWQWVFFCQVFLILFSKCLILIFVIAKTIFHRFPKLENYFMLTCCGLYFSAFLCCVPMFTSFGVFMLKQFFWMTLRGSMIILMNLLQASAILYIYGLTTVVDDLHFMLGFRMSFFWQIILVLNPPILLVMWIVYLLNFYNFKRYTKCSFSEKFFLNAVAYLPIYTTLGYSLYSMRWIIWKCKWENIFRHGDGWYLKDPILRKSRQMFSAMSMTKEYLYRQTKKQETSVYDMDEAAYEAEAGLQS